MMIFPFLTTDTYISKIAVLDKEMYELTKKNEYFWKKLFLQEFHYSPEKFGDVEKNEDGSDMQPRDLFINSFKLFKRIRGLLVRMLNETARSKSFIFAE
jgi:hypothetical protein